MPHKFKGKSKWQASSKTPNASFRSRSGAISINLATKGATDDDNKAYVQASTRKCDISINLYSLQTGKHINLDASSRKGECEETHTLLLYLFHLSIFADITSHTGHILVLIPRNFCGAIQLKSRKGGCKVLPALSSASRILTAKDREALILVADSSSLSSSPGTADDLATDFCQLESGGGKVTVGFSGEDKYVPVETGMWQKLGEFFRGGSA
jgi:hypothetical protein